MSQTNKKAKMFFIKTAAFVLVSISLAGCAGHSKAEDAISSMSDSGSGSSQTQKYDIQLEKTLINYVKSYSERSEERDFSVKEDKLQNLLAAVTYRTISAMSETGEIKAGNDIDIHTLREAIDAVGSNPEKYKNVDITDKELQAKCESFLNGVVRYDKEDGSAVGRNALIGYLMAKGGMLANEQSMADIDWAGLITLEESNAQYEEDLKFAGQDIKPTPIEKEFKEFKDILGIFNSYEDNILAEKFNLKEDTRVFFNNGYNSVYEGTLDGKDVYAIPTNRSMIYVEKDKYHTDALKKLNGTKNPDVIKDFLMPSSGEVAKVCYVPRDDNNQLPNFVNGKFEEFKLVESDIQDVNGGLELWSEKGDVVSTINWGQRHAVSKTDANKTVKLYYNNTLISDSAVIGYDSSKDYTNSINGVLLEIPDAKAVKDKTGGLLNLAMFSGFNNRPDTLMNQFMQSVYNTKTAAPEDAATSKTADEITGFDAVFGSTSTFADLNKVYKDVDKDLFTIGLPENPTDAEINAVKDRIGTKTAKENLVKNFQMAESGAEGKVTVSVNKLMSFGLNLIVSEDGKTATISPANVITSYNSWYNRYTGEVAEAPNINVMENQFDGRGSFNVNVNYAIDNGKVNGIPKNEIVENLPVWDGVVEVTPEANKGQNKQDGANKQDSSNTIQPSGGGNTQNNNNTVQPSGGANTNQGGGYAEGESPMSGEVKYKSADDLLKKTSRIVEVHGWNSKIGAWECTNNVGKRGFQSPNGSWTDYELAEIIWPGLV